MQYFRWFSSTLEKKYKKLLELACAQFNLECEKYVNGYRLVAFLGMPKFHGEEKKAIWI